MTSGASSIRISLLINGAGPESGCTIFVPVVASAADRMGSFVFENDRRMLLISNGAGINNDRNYGRVFHVPGGHWIHDDVHWNLVGWMLGIVV